jgi:hypothetical protein
MIRVFMLGDLEGIFAHRLGDEHEYFAVSALSRP